MPLALTRALGELVASTSRRDVSANAAAIAQCGFVDAVGTMIAGAREPAPTILRRVLDPPAGPSSLCFGTQRAPAPDAAWINGTAAHALDYDDVALRGHPSCVLVPAILAEAECLDASGAQMIVAYVVGFETWAELVRRERGYHHGKGWHPTGIFGTVAAAAACASLRTLDAHRATHALALGATQSSGLSANFGSMAKPFHAGRAAHSGIISARLAAAGFTASAEALEQRAGFLTAVSPSGDVDLGDPPATLGREWRIETDRLAIKRYPVCYYAHRSIDAVLDLMRGNPVDPADIDRIVVTISESTALVLRHHLPQTVAEARFSIEFAMASAIIAGDVGLAELVDDFVRRPDVQALMARVEVANSTELDPGHPGVALHDRARVELASGTVLGSEPVRRPRGHPERPLDDGELYAKFAACVTAGSKLDPGPLFERLHGLDHTRARQLTAHH